MSEFKYDDNKFDGTLESMELMRDKWSGTYYDRIDDVFHALYDVYEHRQFAEDIKKIADRYLETGSNWKSDLNA